MPVHRASKRLPAPSEFNVRQETIRGPLPFLNATRARYDWSKTKTDNESPPPEKGDGSDNVQVQWTTRDNRKGRHVIVVPRSSPVSNQLRSSSHPRAVLLGVWRMFTVFPYWDVSWLVGVFFTIGCLIFIVCGLFYWLPIAYPSTEFPDEDTTAGGVLSFVGATLFQIGAILLVFEACNEDTTGCFGSAVESLFHSEEEGGMAKVPSCRHLHRHGKMQDSEVRAARSWKWLPTWKELTTHYIYEIGFLASITMTIGATVFYVSGILSLPGVYDHLSQGVLDGVYWMTYLVGGVLFIISSVLYVLEVQPKWYIPAPKVLGWHIGVWNLIGSIGWTLSAAFGYCSSSASWCDYQSDLSLIWASIAFTIGSALLWYESLDKYPIIISE